MRSLLRKIKSRFFSKKYKSQIEYWNERAKNYGVRSVIHLGHSEEELEKITQFQKDFLLPKLKEVLTGNENIVLDFGCGPGRFSEALAKLTECKVVAIDPIKHLIELAPPAAGVEYKVMLEGNIPMENDSVDVVWICLVFGSITDNNVLQQTVAEIKRVLKQGGLIFMVEKTSEDLSNFQTKSVTFYKKMFDFVKLDKIDEYTDIEDCNTVFLGRNITA